MTVTGVDMPWTHAEVEALRGFEEFRPLFMLYIHDDGPADWRWHAEPFDTVNQ